MKIVKRNVKDLVPYAGNPLDHPEEEIEGLMKLIQEFDFLVPVVIDKDNEIAAGHARIHALKRLGRKKVDCVLADHLTKAQIKAFRIADNKWRDMATWNDDRLAQEITDLQDSIELDILGFSSVDLATLLDADEEGELKETTISIRPYKKSHILLSFHPDLLVDIQPYLEKILSIEGVEHEQGTN